MPWRRQTSATQTPGFSVSCTAHFCSPLKRPAVRPPVRFLRYQAILTPRNWRRPLIEPGHSDEAGFTSPFRRRICRGDRVRCAAHAVKRRGILSVPHAAEVHRFDMHAPGSPKRNRTTVRAHAVAIPHPSGNAVVGRAVTGMKIKGMPTFRTRALSGLTNSQQDRAIDRRKRLSTGVTFARPVDGRL
jgi:hypothetical protein